MLSLSSLQEYLCFKARQHHEVVFLPPFNLFLHTTDFSTESNYAIPDPSESDSLPESLIKLHNTFIEYGRKPCLVFIEELFPHLTTVLRSSAWSQQKRLQIMICTLETYHATIDIPGLTIITLSSRSSLEEICEGLDTNASGFDSQAERVTSQEAERFRQDLILSRAFTTRLHGQPVGAGMFTDIHEDLTELVGITTLEPFRRRGIATALTAHMTQIAFKQGARQVFLIAVNELASHIYERVGFRPYATYVHYEYLPH